ncbi:cupin domain-containing protein [Streptobacillus moniliformis]|uniref:cupin domain-containing protein n=1 Tax=Streptobacillus moniliformis TaxID=34105 RepID=UPI0007E3CC6D|nr:cupin domain-containing protein [Streptobacillus moniliformis]
MINEYGELVEVLMDDKIKVERITSNSNVTDFMISDLDEYVYILEGCSKLLVGEKEIFLNKDTGFFIPKNTEHKVTYTSSDCKWLCIFLKE